MADPEPTAPRLWWKPSAVQWAKPMIEEGTVPGSPFPDFDRALRAADDRRESDAEATPADNVYLITYAPGGWLVFEYSERRLGKADLGELRVNGLPLGGSLEEPRTFLVDARGLVGRLVFGPGTREYGIEEADRGDLGSPAAPDPYIPAIVPAAVHNHGRNVRWRPRVVLRPDPDVDRLSTALRWVDDHLPAHATVKAGGWRHSWSPVSATQGVYVLPDLLRGVEPLATIDPAREGLSDDVDRTSLFRVLSGTRIRQINAELWAAGRAVPWLGGYDGQTLGGVLPTGTHGSVLRRGPLAEMVRSLDLVRFDGGRVRIEPASRPLTAPDAFRSARPGWELEQDDDVFGSAILGLGSLGVIHALVVEAVPRFWLNEVRTATTLPEAKAVLSGGNVYHLMECDERPGWIDPLDDRAFADHPKPAYHEELLWNVYTDKVVVTSRHPVSDVRRRELEQDEPSWFAHAPVRDLARALKLDVMADDYSRPDLAELATEHLHGVLDDVLEVLARARPQVLPDLIDRSLAGMPDPAYTQRSYKVFHIGEGANAIPAQSGTFCVPLRDDLWLRAVDIVRATARRLADEHRLYQTGPIALRFVRGSAIPLADPEDVCKFEVIFGGDSEPVQSLSREVLKAHDDALRAELGAEVRWHWGQLVPDGVLDPSRIRESYPRYETWRAIRDRLDPSGRGLNAWLRRILP